MHVQAAEMMAKCKLFYALRLSILYMMLMVCIVDDMGRRIDNLEASIQAEKSGKEESSQ